MGPVAMRAVLLTLVCVGTCSGAVRDSSSCNEAKGCCTFRRGPLRGIECDLSQRKTEQRIPKHKTSAAYQIMHFSNGSQVDVIVDYQALDRMQEVQFSGLRSVTFRGDGGVSPRAALPGAPGSASLTIDGVSEVRLEAGSLGGWPRGHSSEVVIRSVRRCVVSRDALPGGAALRRLQLEHIGSLELEQEAALHTSVSELLLRNVTLPECAPASLPAASGSLQVISSTMSEVRADCLRLSPDAHELTIRDSRLGHVARAAITGHVRRVSVRNCSMASVAGGGLWLNVTQLNVSGLRVGELHAGGLWLNVTQLNVSGLRVDELHAGALQQLHVRAARRRGPRRSP